MEDVHAAVAHAALAWLAETPAAHRKLPLGREWAVLAAFVLRERETGACRVLAAATGNKCVGRRELDADGLVVHDCHAEVLARRALLRFLYAEAAAFHRSGPHAASVFAWREATHRLALRAQYSLHLFVSEAPCGDAAIYALKDAVVDALAARRKQRTAGADAGRSVLRVTGAKMRHVASQGEDSTRPAKRAKQGDGDGAGDGDSLQGADETADRARGDLSTAEHQFAQRVGIARVKSGRSDLPPDKQTRSMSCSDKIARWTATGVQSSLLLRFFEPLALATVAVPLDPRAATAGEQLAALQRALVTRVQAATADAVPRLDCAVLADEAFVFDRSKASAPPESLQPSALALNWSRREAHWVQDASPSLAIEAAGVDQRWLGKFLLADDVEVLLAATGLRQGAKKAAKLDRAGLERVASRLARRNLFRAFCLVHQLARDANGAATGASSDEGSGSALDPLRLTYSQAKARVVSASPVREEEDSPSPSPWSAYLGRRLRFASGFRGWVGVPDEYKAFTLT